MVPLVMILHPGMETSEVCPAADREWLMYSVVVTHKVGVICKSCGERIEIDDDYISGVRATEMAVFYKPLGAKFSDAVNVAWQKALTCGNPDCRKTHEYKGNNLRLYGD